MSKITKERYRQLMIAAEEEGLIDRSDEICEEIAELLKEVAVLTGEVLNLNSNRAAELSIVAFLGRLIAELGVIFGTEITVASLRLFFQELTQYSDGEDSGLIEILIGDLPLWP